MSNINTTIGYTLLIVGAVAGVALGQQCALTPRPLGTAFAKLAVSAALASVGLAVLASSAWVPGDPLRLRKGWNELVMANDEGAYNSSLGARVYLWRLGWEGFRGGSGLLQAARSAAVRRESAA